MNEIAAGKFISVEGGEGVGKTTNIEFIQSLLAKKNIQAVVSREPGGTQIAEKLRDLLVGHSDEELDSTTELLLIFAARAQHIKHIIAPALSTGMWVVCDRFTDATYAYQGAGRGINPELIAQLELAVQQGLQPDLTLLLDIDPKIGMQRARARAELDRFELESLPFFNRVRSHYLERARTWPERFAVVDASATLAEVQQSIELALKPLLSGHPG